MTLSHAKKRTKPTTYNKMLFQEEGAVVKDWGGKVSLGLVFPNTYYIGMSNLGLHAIYSVANSMRHAVCERFFLPEEGVPKRMLSIETQRQLSDFDIVAFSIPFENDFLNILPVLNAAKIPFFKTEKRPLMIAGGAAVTLNPEPLSRFFDVLVLGDGEVAVKSILEILSECRDVERLFDSLVKTPGIYIPEIHKNDIIKPYFTKDINGHPSQTAIWTRHTEFGDMHLIEIQRGCPWRCRFCAAPVVYGTCRDLSIDAIKSCILNGLKHRGKFGLIGGDPLSHPNFEEVADFILKHNASFSLSSLRADRITRETAQILRAGGYRTATIAPETGSPALRYRIGKRIPDEKILEAAESLAGAGITRIKLYFMIGLPGEAEDETESIVSLIKEIHKTLTYSRNPKTLPVKISVSVSPFVPKKGTPFEHEDFLGVRELQKRAILLKQKTGKIPDTILSMESPKTAETEAVLNKMGAEGAEYLIERWKRCIKNIL